MPLDALPPGFKDQAEGTNTDWNNLIQKYWHKSWFAYGPRSSHWWAKWRAWPMTIFAIRGPGVFRFEDIWGPVALGFGFNKMRWWNRTGDIHCYLSAIQYWCKWHVAIQWPLHIQMHYYIDPMPVYPAKAGNKRVFYFRFGARRDADGVYWFPSLFLGLQWN